MGQNLEAESITNASVVRTTAFVTLGNQARDKIGQALRDAIKNVRAHSRAEKDASALARAPRIKAGTTKKPQSNNEALVNQSSAVSSNGIEDDGHTQDAMNGLPNLLERASTNSDEMKTSSLLNKFFHQSLTASSANDGRTSSCPQLLPGGKSDLSSFLSNSSASKPPHNESGLSAALSMLESAASTPCLSSNKRKRTLPATGTGNWMQDIVPIDVQVTQGLLLSENDASKRRRQSLLAALGDSAIDGMIEQEKAVPHRRCSGFLESLLGTSPLLVPGPTQREVSALPRDLSNYLVHGPKPHLGERKNEETMFSSAFPSLLKMGSPPKHINQHPPVPSLFCTQEGNQSTRHPSSTSNPLGGLGLLDGSFMVDHQANSATRRDADEFCGVNRDALSQFLTELEPTPILYPATNPLADHARSA